MVNRVIAAYLQPPDAAVCIAQQQARAPGAHQHPAASEHVHAYADAHTADTTCCECHVQSYASTPETADVSAIKRAAGACKHADLAHVFCVSQQAAFPPHRSLLAQLVLPYLI
jgi:hypothetical protein